MPLSITQKNGIYHFSGTIDEFLNDKPISFLNSKVVLNLSGISQINSQGMIQFKKLMETFVGKEVELHDCSTVFVDMLNIFPGMLGIPSRPEIVKSIMVDFQCINCEKNATRRIQIRDQFNFKIEGDSDCKSCGEQTATMLPLEEHFLFFSDRD